MLNAEARLRAHLSASPIVAILRGVTPREIDGVADALVEAGIQAIEVPLNSPTPFASIERLAARVGDVAMVGAGTVTRPSDVGRVSDAGGALVVSPNVDPGVIREALRRGAVPVPGYFTATEAFTALHAGANILKLFPAVQASPAALRAQLAVFPQGTQVLAVGGIESAAFQDWWAGGARGFGIGAAIYTPGMDPSEVLGRARNIVSFAHLAERGCLMSGARSSGN